MFYRGGLVVIIAIILSGGTACTETRTAQINPYETEFTEAKAASVNDFQLRILDDGKITAEEYSETQQKYTDCLDDEGFTVVASMIDGAPQYDVTYAKNDQSRFESVEAECGKQSIALIEPLYMLARDNPQAKDMNDVRAECLVKKGIAPSGFTGNELKAILDSKENTTSVNSPADDSNKDDRNIEIPLDPQNNLGVIPGGGSLDTDEAWLCFTNPQAN
ncbi:hypothetical protein GCM10022198_12530 [Klugiella xanthotipulae]|uniref:Lipoprotein n=1 Tax=Klugiella xanthotipulae TaxID=244735 RepID=A0A543I423_9MICO|nr:hypothetical protein [Klugiella xanthotipulae]TQM65339.1 hypothetical protein FB466_0136 [Klugiella xanthotipulae]